MSSIINVEVKAKSEKIENIRNYLMENKAKYLGIDTQTDTYFLTNYGRLKLREGNIENSLILYYRENTEGSKLSNINLVKLETNSGLSEILEKSNGILTIVKKAREIYFIENVKFHIDIVEGLGEFVEIEAIDTNGEKNKEELTQQCEHYMNCFEIKKQDIINVSYSDLIIQNGKEFRQELEKEAISFIKEIDAELADLNIDLESSFIDHLCFRVETVEDYLTYKQKFSCVGKLLIESVIGGRNIANFKLFKPIQCNGKVISVIELPAPKANSSYKTGFEHAEFVISKSFQEIQNSYKNINFDTRGLEKKHNPELKLKLKNNISIKFHHKSLENLIEAEKTTCK